MEAPRSHGLTKRQKIWIAAVVVANALLLALLGISTYQVAEKAKLGQNYVTTIAPSSPGLKGEAGPQGPPPTPEQVAQAVYDYCASTGICEGKTPSMSVVFAAVSQFCADGKCKGETGAEGNAGSDAVPVTNEDIQSAVVNYCANGKCTGPAGPTGPAGESITGDPGVDGEAPASWKFTYLTTEYTCERDDPFDASSPKYTCEPTPATTPPTKT